MNAMRTTGAGALAVGAIALASLTGGCANAPARSASGPPATKTEAIRINSYSLLHDVLDEERNVDKLLTFKLESNDLHNLIKSIASASGQGAKQIEEFAQADRTLRLQQNNLPPGETATRAAITSAKTREFLTPFNPNFEFDLLLTQAEALNYASHLAKVASEHEANVSRANVLGSLALTLHKLREQTCTLLKARAATAKGKTS